MHTIRDDYYIITGHTYDEYLKKYHFGISKGRLLTYKENEIKYLSKHKFYWEVTDKEGHTLYCQVHRIRKIHVITTILIIALIAALITCGVIFIPKI